MATAIRRLPTGRLLGPTDRHGETNLSHHPPFRVLARPATSEVSGRSTAYTAWRTPSRSLEGDQLTHEHNPTLDEHDPWRLPGGIHLPGSHVSVDEQLSGSTLARELNREQLRKRRLARQWWKSKLGRQEFTRQRRQGELLNIDLDRWLAHQTKSDQLLDQHQLDVRLRRQRLENG